MGRWAEVYFTSPPEKRAEAVSELVKELKGEGKAGEVFSRTEENDDFSPEYIEHHDESLSKEEQIKTRTEPAGSEERNLICGSCGHHNRALQRFCGMCGTPLSSWPEENVGPAAESGRTAEELKIPPEEWLPAEAQVPENNAPQYSAPPYSVPQYEEVDRKIDYKVDHAVDHEVDREVDYKINREMIDETEMAEREARAQIWQRPVPSALPSFEGLSEYESAPASHNYRLYGGVILAILLGLLVYMTWRGNSAFWSSSGAPSSLPQAVPVPSDSGPVPGDRPPAAPAAAPAQPAHASHAPASSASNTPAAPKVPTQKQPSAGGREKVVEKASRPANLMARNTPARTRVAPKPIAAAPNPSVGASEQYGAEELAMAQKYLNGSNGARDSRQAAQWLWKAVAKQNLSATMLLSDLYLRGDGVAKSCDQARLLLDAAARKGGTAAALRLRNLQAFGCQ